MNLETMNKGKLELARRIRKQALDLCQSQPGYGTGNYRGDPWEAVAMQQQADKLEGNAA
jgi:hypothetical protein